MTAEGIAVRGAMIAAGVDNLAATSVYAIQDTGRTKDITIGGAGAPDGLTAGRRVLKVLAMIFNAGQSIAAPLRAAAKVFFLSTGLAGIAGVADPVAVIVRLIGVKGVRTIIAGVFETITVGVIGGANKFA